MVGVIFLWTNLYYIADSLGYDILDGVQPHHDLGLAGVLLRAGLLLQLRDRRSLRGLPDGGADAGHVLVHRGADCEDPP